MQGLGTIDNEFTILSIKHTDSERISYLAKHNQTQDLRIIEFKRGNLPENFPAQEIDAYIKCSS
jgi:hypothetical protein